MATTETQAPEPHVADTHDLIRVQGARENNLKDVSVEIPKRRLTAFTGVSGSGKSSLVFSTIAAESQRMINETYSAFVQGFMPTLSRPEVDVLDGLTTAIIVDQERMGANPRSTVGTVTDANAMLRILFSRLGQPHIGSPSAFAFNVPSVRASGAIEGSSRPRIQSARSLICILQASAMLIPAIFDDRAASASRVPSQSGQVVNVTARSTKARMCGCIASRSLDRIDFWTLGTRPS